jgi:hypothetical protein
MTNCAKGQTTMTVTQTKAIETIRRQLAPLADRDHALSRHPP